MDQKNGFCFSGKHLPYEETSRFVLIEPRAALISTGRMMAEHLMIRGVALIALFRPRKNVGPHLEETPIERVSVYLWSTCCNHDAGRMSIMRFITLLGALTLMGAFSCSSFASEPKAIKWQDLAPKPVQLENPFKKLSGRQLSELRKILRHEQAAQGDKIPAEAIATLRAKLEAEGLDVDFLFAQRKSIMEKRQELVTKTNDKLLGKVVRLPGYLLPLDIRDRKAVEFLLVPTVGACIHVPAPPPNQMVHVSYPVGFPFEELYRPIWIVGTLKAETITRDVGLSDGTKQIEVGYKMTADAVEPYQK